MEQHMRDIRRAADRERRGAPYDATPPAVRAARERPPLPFDPAMMDDMLLIPKSMRVRRIALWWEHDCLTHKQLNALLAEHWGLGGWPADMGLGTRRLVGMFKDAGFVTDTEGVAAPTEPLTLYRGAGVHAIRGMAWSTDERVAAWFARRLMLVYPESGPCLYTITMPPRHVLGRFLSMGEEEVVVNAFALRGRLDARSGVYAADPRVIALAGQHEEERIRRARR